MIKGIGTDIVNISRIEKAMQQEKFLEKTFTPREREERKHKVENYAAAFAAKEAVVKALGSGFRGIGFHDIEILHEENGKPYICLYGKKEGKWYVSLSHEKEYAVAMVVWEE